jgi:pimeloyl-ACP methyl ester carboxylesterase
MDRSRRITAGIALAAGLLLALAAPALAREARVTVATPPAAGPAQYNQVWVDKYGPAKAKRVLVLMPGTIAGSGNFTLTARHLVKKVPDLQVWAIDRRSQALEQTTVFQQALSGQKTLKEAFDHYLGFISNGGLPADHYEFLDGPGDYPFAREWGMGVALNDARAVVLQARKGGRKVVLGGHSLGASLTAAYAVWDFNGRPGYKDLAGLVLIDGGLLGSFDAFDRAQAEAQVNALKTADPFADLLGLGIPEVAGLFAEIGGLYAKLAPTAPATDLQEFPLLPDAFNPPFPVTNRGLLGYAFDRNSSPQDLRLLHINAGGLSGVGSPQDWVDGGVTPISRLAATFGQEPANGVEWFFPKRLTIDTNGANELIQNDVAQFLGLRLQHLRKVDRPLYAMQTDLTAGGVLAGARSFISKSRTTRKESALVNADPINAHIDPLTALPKKNRFFKTVAPFLRYKVFGDPKKKKKKGKGKGKGGGKRP